MTVYVGSLKYSPVFKSHCCAFGKECEREGYPVKYLFSKSYEWMLPEEIKEKTTFIGNTTDFVSMVIDGLNFRCRKKIGRVFSECNATHIYMHNYHLLNHLIAELSEKHNICFIQHVHEPYTENKKAHGNINQYVIYLSEHFQERLLEKTDVSIVSSKMASSLFDRRYPNFSGKKRLIPLMFEDLGGSAENSQDRKYVTFVGPPVPAKGPETFLEIIDHSNKSGLDLDFLLISNAKVRGSRYYRKNNLELFHKPKITDEEFGKLIQRSLMVITPYKRETQSSVIPVSYMYGTPVVSSDTGGLVEFVSHKHTGYLVDKQARIEEWIEGISFVRKNFSRMTTYCRSYFVEKFSGKNWRKYLGDLLN